MSNKASDHLFKLINSLSKAEKRYFKIYTSRHTIGESNNYHQLFDFIDKLEEYDEELIKSHFHDESFIQRLSIAKSRLYEAILKSLDAFYSNSSVEARLKRTLHCVEILYKKSLYKQASKQLRSAKKLALKNEKYTSLIEIQVWEKLLIEKDNYEGIKELQLASILENDLNYLDKIQAYTKLWNVKSRLFTQLFRQGKARSKDELMAFKSIIDKTFTQVNIDDVSTDTKYLYHHVNSAYYYAIGDYKQSYDSLLKNETLIKNYPLVFKEEPNIYASVLTNLVYVCQQLKKFDEAKNFLTLLRQLPEKLQLDKTEDLDLRLFASTYSIELTLYAITGNFEQGINLLPIVEEGLNLYEEKLSAIRKASFYFNIAYLHFGVEDYNNALKWINKLLNDIDIDKTEDLHCFAQLLNLIIHVELNNERLLPYAMRSTQRYLTTRNRVYKFESVFLQFITKITRAKDVEQEEAAFDMLIDGIKPLTKDHFEAFAFEYFDFLSWAESKRNKVLFSEVIRAKNQTNS